jgi:glycosyltransferase involved in cell wall biosynthesis
VKLLIVGDGPERGLVEQRAQELSLGPDTIAFLGSRSDVDDLLEASDFFVLPSVTEGMPLSVLEAMAHALPIVASRVGGLPELIDDEQHGLLVPADDAHALAVAIRRVVCDASLRRRLGKAGRERASSEFSLEMMTARYHTLYERAIAGGSSSR